MKAQCRQQTDDSVRYAFRRLHQSVVFGYAATLGNVQPSSDLPHEAAILRLAEVLSRDADFVQFTRPEYSSFANEASDLFCLGWCHFKLYNMSAYYHNYQHIVQSPSSLSLKPSPYGLRSTNR